MESSSPDVATSDKSKRRRAPRKKPAAAPRKPSSKIAGVVPVLAFQGENEDLWPTLASFRWFIRNNRPQLINNGALLEISGRAFVHVENFKSVVLAVGRNQALKSGCHDAADGQGSN